MARVLHADLHGLRPTKYERLSRLTLKGEQGTHVTPNSPYYVFGPQDQAARVTYEAGWKVTDIFPVHSLGVVTARDDLSIHFTAEEAWETVKAFAFLAAEVARKRYCLGRDARDWKIELAQADLKRDGGPQRDRIVPVLYRPFDIRYTYYTGRSRGFHCMPRGEVMRHMMAGANVGLATGRSVETERGFEHVGVATTPIGHHSVSLKEVNYLFPLYRFPTEKEAAMGIGKEPNLRPALLDELSGTIGRSFGPVASWGGGAAFTPEDVSHYIYGALHSPVYRSRYAEFLKIDFPRIPLPGGPEVFHSLAKIGGELVGLHLMESPRLDQHMTTFMGGPNPQVEKVAYTDQTVWLDKAQTRGFRGVPEDVWNFHIGGYQVCEKWLKDRGPKKGQPGRILSPEDIEHYHKIVVALSETIRIMKAIDVVIEAHGGWPGAFHTPSLS